MSEATSLSIDLDALLFGGGIAGLWLLDELRRQGYSALLLEAYGLGNGQTASCQGIIHGGLKYMLGGWPTAAAQSIVEMPEIWRQCFAGQREPDLAGTPLSSEACFLWGTGSLKSRLSLTAASFVLRTRPRPVDRSQRPTALAGIPGEVWRVPEPVIDPSSLLASLAERNRGRLLQIDATRCPELQRDQDQIRAVRIYPTLTSSPGLEIRATTVILTAGEGNEALRQWAGLPPGAMQRRPLHMVMARGNLPELYGHCVAGSKTRITITSAWDSAGRRVWQIGGQIAEEGVSMDGPALRAFARQELLACLPGLNLQGAELCTYRIDRAEAATSSGQRPDDVQFVREGNLITAWPTKLALAPRLARRILELLPPPAGRTRQASLRDLLGSWPIPPVAPAPWEACTQWHSVA